MSTTKKNLGHTFISTSLLLVLQVANIILSTQLLGSTGRGEISLYLLHIAIGAQIGSMVGGEALVYFTPRFQLTSILRLSTLWNIAVALISFCVFWRLIPEIKVATLLSVGIFIQSSFQCTLQVSNGLELIKKSNLAFLISQIVFTAAILVFYSNHALTPETFIISMVIGLVLAIIYLIGVLTKNHSHSTLLPKLSFTKAFKNGIIIQFGNVAQTLNTRVSYWLLDSFFANGKALVGIFSTALLVSEKSLVVPRSLGRVQYSETANSKTSIVDKTVRYLKLYMALALIVLSILCFVPNQVFVWVFGSEFDSVGLFVRILAPGMLLLMGSNAMSNYFAGLGKYSVNAICTLIALAVSGVFAVLTVPQFGIIAAAISADLAFFVLCCSQLIYFNKINAKELPKIWLLPNKGDYLLLKKTLNKVK